MENVGFFKNKDSLKSVLETLIFLGKSNIDPYRDPFKNPNKFDSQSEDSEDESNGEDNSNLQSILNLRMSTGDEKLLQEFKGIPATKQYIPKQIQVELVKLLGETITERIAEEVKQGGFYAIIAANIQGISNAEDFYPICVRYLKESKVVEHFFAYVYSDSSCHMELALNICHAIENAGLDINMCRALNLDGAGSSQNLSAVKDIKQQHPLALHFHNHATQLDTTLAYVMPTPSPFAGLLSNVSTLFNTVEHCREVLEAELKRYISASNSEELANEFRSLLTTKDCFKKFSQCFEGLLNALVSLEYDTSYRYNFGDSNVSSPNTLLCVVDEYETVFQAILHENLFSHLSSMTNLLKGNGIDVIYAYLEATEVVQELECLRADIDTFHSKCYEKAKKLSSKLDIPDKVPFMYSRKANILEPVIDWYKHKRTVPLIDVLIKELKSRFSPECVNAVKGLAVIPAVMLQMISDGKLNWSEMFKDFCMQYKHDLPIITNLASELDAWQEKWSQPGGMLDQIKHSVLLIFAFDALMIHHIHCFAICVCYKWCYTFSSI